MLRIEKKNETLKEIESLWSELKATSISEFGWLKFKAELFDQPRQESWIDLKGRTEKQIFPKTDYLAKLTFPDEVGNYFVLFHWGGNYLKKLAPSGYLCLDTEIKEATTTLPSQGAMCLDHNLYSRFDGNSLHEEFICFVFTPLIAQQITSSLKGSWLRPTVEDRSIYWDNYSHLKKLTELSEMRKEQSDQFKVYYDSFEVVKHPNEISPEQIEALRRKAGF
jgi:hypothetical protein